MKIKYLPQKQEKLHDRIYVLLAFLLRSNISFETIYIYKKYVYKVQQSKYKAL